MVCLVLKLISVSALCQRANCTDAHEVWPHIVWLHTVLPSYVGHCFGERGGSGLGRMATIQISMPSEIRASEFMEVAEWGFDWPGVWDASGSSCT